MSKNYKVTVTGNVTAEINGNENKINTLDNSINKNKYITKSKNKEKKNRNILPPQEPPTFENGNFSSKTKEVFNHNRLNPEIFDVSFIRPNLEILYNEGQQVEMFAYVECYRKHDERFVLCNLCSESDFLSDHILVDLDPEGELENRIGQCIKFNGVVYVLNFFPVLLLPLTECVVNDVATFVEEFVTPTLRSAVRLPADIKAT